MSLSLTFEFCPHFQSLIQFLPFRFAFVYSVILSNRANRVAPTIHPPHIRIRGLENYFHMASFHLITYSFKGQLVSDIPHKIPNSTNSCLVYTWRISTDLPSFMNNKFLIWAPSALSLMTFPFLGKGVSVHLQIPVFIYFSLLTGFKIH